MARLIIDAATSLDGFWADTRGRSVFPRDRMQEAGLVGPLAEACGAVVMSQRSFDAVEDPDWYADHYELQVPIFVVTDSPPLRRPRENAALRFHFPRRFTEAFRAAEEAAGGKAVLVIGESSAVDAALASGRADEMWLRVVDRTLGAGSRLFETTAPGPDYFVSELMETDDTVHLHLKRRVARHEFA